MIIPSARAKENYLMSVFISVRFCILLLKINFLSEEELELYRTRVIQANSAPHRFLDVLGQLSLSPLYRGVPSNHVEALEAVSWFSVLEVQIP